MAVLSEEEWQVLRTIRDKALDRFYVRIVSEAAEKCRFADAGISPREAFGQIYRSVRDNNKLLGILFNDWRRLTAYATLSYWVSQGLLTRDEFGLFSDSTKKELLEHFDITYFEH